LQYQTFRGSNVNEALAAVRAALGPEAVIDSTRYVTNGRRGALGYSYVEISAAPPKQSASPRGTRALTSHEPPLARPDGPRAADEFDPQSFARELESMRALLEELCSQRTPRDQALALLHTAGIDGELARLLVKKGTRAPRGPALLRPWLRKRLADHVRVQASPIAAEGPQLVACVGPTGAGKTTTLAKLAARARLDLERSVGVISLDTFRVGAADQWKRYARLLGVPFHVAGDPEAFARALDGLDVDILLVDTAGRTPGDPASQWILPACLERVSRRAVHVLGVLPAWLSARDATRALSSYSEPAPTGIVVTKVDEASAIGGPVQAAALRELPIPYLCRGPRVPDDIEDASTATVLDALLGDAS